MKRTEVSAELRAVVWNYTWQLQNLMRVESRRARCHPRHLGQAVA
jgi:hypothetical protein